MELEEIGKQLSAAAVHGDFEKVPMLSCRYRVCFDEVWTSVPETSRPDSSLPGQALLLHQEVIRLLVEARTAKAAELHSVRRASPYTRRGAAADVWRMTF